MPFMTIITAANTVSRAKARLFLRCGDHHGYNERDLYNCDGDCKHQRAKRLAGSVRDDLGVKHGRRNSHEKCDPGRHGN